MRVSARLLLAAGIPAALLLAGCDSGSDTTSANSVYTPPMATVTPIPPPAGSSGSGAAMGSSGTGAAIGSGTSTAPGMRLTRQDLQSTMSGQTATGIARNGDTYYAYFAPNGQVHFEEGTIRDDGTWWVSDDGRLCSRLNRLNAGEEQCYSIYRSGTSLTYNSPDGQNSGVFTTLRGNPRQL